MDFKVLHRQPVDGKVGDMCLTASVLDADPPEAQRPRALLENLHSVMIPAYIDAADLQSEGIARLDVHALRQTCVSVDDEIRLVAAHIVAPLRDVLDHGRLRTDAVP